MFSYLLLYGLATIYASILGGYLALRFKLGHRTLQLALSLVSGLILGIAFLHLFPEAVEHLGSAQEAGLWFLAGLLAIFLLERFFCFHHHEEDDGHHCDKHHNHSLGWTGLTIGMSVHSILAGVAIASALSAELLSGQALPGLGVALAVLLHKPFDSLSIVSLMQKGLYSDKAKIIVVGLFSLAVPLGMGIFCLGSQESGFMDGKFLGISLAASAGVFACIALSDLLPELHFHSHDKLPLTLALLAGLGLSMLEELLHVH